MPDSPLQDPGIAPGILETAREAARRAGEIQRARFGDPGKVAFKVGADPVTEVDLACEAAIMFLIRERFPDHDILTEEAGADGSRSPHRWIVDPLDGTINFSHGFPVFGSSVAYSREGRVLAGACSVPMWGEDYWAQRGQGAFCNGLRLRVSPEEDLSRSLLATGFRVNIGEQETTNLDQFARALFACQALRRPGAAVVDLCCVAAGRFEGFWEFGLSPWDTAAGALMVEEAGGLVTDLGGGDHVPGAPVIVATNGHIHDPLRRLLAGR